jgi:hypothetical protein
MKDLFLEQIGKLWDQWNVMRTFWNSNCVAPWNNWTFPEFKTAFFTPSNNCQESWHKTLQVSKIPGLMRASTEKVITMILPQLIRLDGILIPDELCFRLQVGQIPAAMMQKALWYVEHQSTHIQAFKANDGSIEYYILRKDNPGEYTKITKKLIQMYENACNGVMDSRLRGQYEALRDVCMSIQHVVPCESDEDPSYFPCDANKALLNCVACKGYKGHGICSHVLAVNHILQHFNVKHHLRELCSARKVGGNRTRKLKALEHDIDAGRYIDSSDEELELRRLEGNGA